MENLIVPNFIIIDDDDVSSFICKKIIEGTFPRASISIYTDPVKGIKYLDRLVHETPAFPVCLFLDLTMPETDGWHVLEIMKEMEGFDINRVHTYVLSNSLDFDDINRANDHPVVSAYIKKPLSANKLQIILRNYRLGKDAQPPN